MKLHALRKGAMLVTVSALLIFVITMLGWFAFGCYISDGGRGWNVPIREYSKALTWDGKSYTFTGENLLEEDCWMMLLNPQGRVVWSLRKPEDVPEQYTLTDVASFTRWYLEDYPVRCWVRPDGLLVVGSPKGSVWKHDIAMNTQDLLQAPLWFAGIFLLALGSVLGLSWLTVGKWFRQDQQVRDAARSNWINGVSHDIRTPLSVVMGYAAQLEDAPDLSPLHRQQASAIRAQSQVIRDLVNDLNLTMRLDCEMQALRKETLRSEAFLRQLGADFLNGGMGADFDFEIDLPEIPLPEMNADPFLLRRAINNLLTNCVWHNSPGGLIRLGAKTAGKWIVLWVEGGTLDDSTEIHAPQFLEPDGGAAHGTGLRLVAQIAAAHGGKTEFHSGTPYRCELWMPKK